MGSVPTIRTFVPKEVETAAYLNSLGAAMSFLLSPPRCRVRVVTTGPTLTTAVASAVTFDGEDYDTDGIHSTTTNTSRLTIQTPGLYSFTGQVNFGNNATGQRQLDLAVNGAAIGDGYSSGAVTGGGNSSILQVNTELSLNAGDYVEMLAYQNSGGNIVLATGKYTWLACRWEASS